MEMYFGTKNIDSFDAKIPICAKNLIFPTVTHLMTGKWPVVNHHADSWKAPT